MNKETKRKFPPREGDMPRDELCKAANQAVKQWGEDIDIHFKFTCPYCGERCMLQEPNKLYENGECHKCGKTSSIKVGGFTVIARIKPAQE